MASKYLTIANDLELRIKKMKAEGDSRLPSEGDLCSMYSCSRQTIRLALEVLGRKGLIVKRRGSGSYIADTVPVPGNKVFFITSDEDEYIYPSLLSLLKNELALNRLELICKSTSGSISREKEILSEVIGKHPAAVIIDPISNMIPNPNIPLMEKIMATGITLIFFERSYPLKGKDPVIVGGDHEEGISTLIHHLAERGRKNIAGLFRMDDSSGLSCYRECMETCAYLSLPFDENGFLLYSGKDRKQFSRGGDEFFRKFIDECLTGKDSVICQNDLVAYHLIRALRKKGISVPGDVSVVSLGNSYYTTRGDISITTASNDEKELCNALINAVLTNKKGKPLRWTLNVRKSS
ncbi:MAG: substrate-binding domain-containing protein [Clostridiales bacterium]|nr:substrate-binding domain-containing protein [Clostridiales bacterium]MBR6484352.1 substrate-binding domain-containing protein [Clostridiales bacterium]